MAEPKQKRLQFSYKQNHKLKQSILNRWKTLDQERQYYMDLWEDLADILMPNAGRFKKERHTRTVADRYRKIVDNTSLRARNILAAGMQAGMASPARKWFSLQSLNPNFMQSNSAKRWFSYNTDTMFSVFGRSNIYQALHAIYQEMAVFGVGAAIIVPDYYTVSRAHQLTIGEYALGHDQNGDIDTLYREFEMTAGQMVKEFGYENVSARVKQLYDEQNSDEWITVLHAIEPRPVRDLSKQDNMNMPFRSVYIEPKADSDHILRESGFPVFPVICGRWDVTSNDVYGDSPGMQAAGDIRQLFFDQRRKQQGLDQQYNPSLQVPFGVNSINNLPGGITHVNNLSQQNGARRLYEVSTDLSAILEDINDIRSRINSAFFVDMFLMISGRVDRTMTATEVASLKEEKMMMIGPTYERMQHELYRRLIDIQFYYMQEAGIVPEPPDELQGMPLKVEFTSIMAQAMKTTEVTTVDRFMATVANASQFKPEVLDLIDTDAYIKLYASMLDVNPELLADEEIVQQIRQERAQAQAQQQEAMLAQQQAETMKSMAGADMSKENALTQAMDRFQGYGE